MIDNKHCFNCETGVMAWRENSWYCSKCDTYEPWATNHATTGEPVILQVKSGVTVKRIRVKYIGSTTDGRAIIRRDGGPLELVKVENVYPVVTNG